VLGLETTIYEIKRAEDIEPVFAALKGQVDALYVAESGLIGANGAQMVSLANNAQLPTVGTTADGARVGILMSYGANYATLDTQLRKPVSVTYRTGFGHAETEIGKW
jgi:ABC-type uncharacterized transport system substrate-binding protein